MEVPSLKDITIENIADFIHYGKLKIRPLQIGNRFLPINSTMSNQIIKKFLEDYSPTAKSLEELKKLSITSVEFSPKNDAMTELSIQMCKTQMIEELTIRFAGPYIKGPGFDLNDLLNNMLADPRRLRYLDISDINRECLGEWLMKIGDSFHNLETLKVFEKRSPHHCYLPLMTSRFPKLKELNIGFPSTVTLNGIQNFENLTDLTITNTRGFQNTFQMVDLFEMRKLERLVVPANRETAANRKKFMELFLECGKSIQELKYLNCANLNLNEDGLRTLIKRQPKLRTIVIVGTNAQHIDIPGVKLYKDNTFRDCIECLEHIIDCKNVVLAVDLCFSLWDLDKVNVSEEEFARLIQILYDVIKMSDDPLVIISVVVCCCQFQQKHYFRDISTSSKNVLTRLMLKIFLDHNDETNVQELSIIQNLWFFFENDDVILNPGWNIDLICSEAVNAFTLYSIEKDEKAAFFCMKFIEKSMKHGKLSDKRMMQMADDVSFVTSIVHYIEQDMDVNDVSLLPGENINSPALEILIHFTSTKELCANVARWNTIQRMIKLLELYSGKPEVKTKVLRFLVNIVTFLDVRILGIHSFTMEGVKTICNQTIAKDIGSNEYKYLACTLLSEILCIETHHQNPEIAKFNTILKTAVQNLPFHELQSPLDFHNCNIFQKIPLIFKIDAPIFWMLKTLKTGLEMKATWIPTISFDIVKMTEIIVHFQQGNKDLIELAEHVKLLAQRPQ